MPICWQENPCVESVYAVWHITEHMDYFLKHLSLDANAGFDAVNHPDKQLQWLASRVLVKVLVESHLNQPFEGIYNDENGKPWLNNISCHVSISNSGNYASASLHKTRSVGIDIERIKPKIKKIAHKYLLPQELISWGKDINTLTLGWCCKETVYKIYGLGCISLKDNIWLSPPEDLSHVKAILRVENATTFYLKSIRFDDYMLAYNYYPVELSSE